MKNLLLAALVIMAASCRKPREAKEAAGVPPAAANGERLIEYDEKHGAFACRAPAEWKAVEDDYSGGPLVMFLNGSASIGITRYPAVADKIKTPAEYLDMLRLTDRKPSELEARQVDGRTVYAVHYEAPRRAPRGRRILDTDREDAVLVPCKDGFFLLSHVAPSDAYRATMPVFDAVVESFRPKG